MLARIKINPEKIQMQSKQNQRKIQKVSRKYSAKVRFFLAYHS